MATPIPTELRIRRATRTLEMDFEDGTVARLGAEYLRVESPSAEVQGHAPGEKTLVLGKQSVGIETVEPVGNYAIRIRFDDGHDTGIYTWAYLKQLAEEHGPRWRAYQQAVTARGAGPGG